MDFKSYFRKAENISKIGKDRCLLLFLAGVLLFMIQGPIEKYQNSQNKQNSITKTQNTYSRDAEKEKTEEENDKDEVILNQSKEYMTSEEYEYAFEKKLEEILSQMDGVGKTEVFVRVDGSSELIVEKDTPYVRENLNETDSEGGQRQDTTTEDEESTVYVKDAEGNEIPFIARELSPKIAGVLVVCQGGGNEEVKTEIVEALQALFDLDVHKIKVVKMNIK